MPEVDKAELDVPTLVLVAKPEMVTASFVNKPGDVDVCVCTAPVYTPELVVAVNVTARGFTV